MNTKITQEFLQKHFKKHNSLTLYKPDGTPYTFTKKYEPVLHTRYMRINFKDCERLAKFCKTHTFTQKPVNRIF